jgi:hypothetical protein
MDVSSKRWEWAGDGTAAMEEARLFGKKAGLPALLATHLPIVPTPLPVGFMKLADFRAGL